MIKVITYGSFDLLHYGHVLLLNRARALGDYLIVGVTSDDYDKTRGKINLQQTLMERVNALKATGLADEIIIEEYEGQKINDIKKYGIDIFTVGSDWEGYFDYLNEYCKVVYLPRTEGVSSSEIREKNRSIKLGLVGDARFLNKVWEESKSVNGLHVSALCTNIPNVMNNEAKESIKFITSKYDEFLSYVDAVYIRSLPSSHYNQIKIALDAGKHVLCESPIALSGVQCEELMSYAKEKGLILMEAIKTAYSTAYNRLLLLIKTGKIGRVISVDSTCTSMKEKHENGEWSSIYEWGPTAVLPIFQILGTDPVNCDIVTHFQDNGVDSFTKISFLYNNSVASIKIGDGYKSEGDLIVSGSKGYIYVPAPWWKTDYFEIRYEDQTNNKRYFYQLEGEGIRYELVAFVRSIERRKKMTSIDEIISYKISDIMEQFNLKEKLYTI